MTAVEFVTFIAVGLAAVFLACLALDEDVRRHLDVWRHDRRHGR